MTGGTRKFQVTITDGDGEAQVYNFRASNMWIVTSHIGGKMASEGDFYGHKLDDTVTLEVAELIPAARDVSPIQLV
jgi:hypothetical protein